MLYLVYNKWGLGVSDGKGNFESLEDANKTKPAEVKALLDSGKIDECEIINDKCYVGEKTFQFIVNTGMIYPDDYTIQYVKEFAGKYGGKFISKQLGDMTFVTYCKECFDALVEAAKTSRTGWKLTPLVPEPTVTIEEVVEEEAVVAVEEVIDMDEADSVEEIDMAAVDDEEDAVEVDELVDVNEIDARKYPNPKDAVCDEEAIAESDGFDMDRLMEEVSGSFEEDEVVVDEVIEEDEVEDVEGNESISDDNVIEDEEDEEVAFIPEIIDIDELDDTEPERETVVEPSIDKLLSPYTKTIIPKDCKGETYAFTYDYMQLGDVVDTAFCIENNFERRGDYWIMDVIQRGMRIVYSEKNQYKHEFRIDDCSR